MVLFRRLVDAAVMPCGGIRYNLNSKYGGGEDRTEYDKVNIFASSDTQACEHKKILFTHLHRVL